MFKKIADKMTFPDWAPAGSRWRRLDILDKLLDGKFYDHLPSAFYDEMSEGSQKSTIPLENRRPSAQYRMQRQVARWCGRRLFASRHQPKIRHKDKKFAKKVAKLLTALEFWPAMLCAAYYGSVGAVAVTFRRDENQKIALKVRRAKYITPMCNELDELVCIRLHIPTTGEWIKATVPGAVVEDGQKYWFVRDYLPKQEITYTPVKQKDWNPEQGFTGDGVKAFTPMTDGTITHNLGFVPGVWIVNMAGGDGVDGSCTWEDAVPNMIDMDYTMSQAGRGIRYNCAPQPVIKGSAVTNGPDGVFERGPMAVINLAPGTKDETGFQTGDGDAWLLEMEGTGIESAHAHVDKLHELAFQQICASRRNPEHMKGVMSGRAMEFLEEDPNDLVMDLRTQYGERGCLALIRKIVTVCMETDAGKVDGLSLGWPRLFQPTPDDLSKLIPALQLAVTPIADPTQIAMSSPLKNADGSTTPPPTPPAPPADSPHGKTLLKLEEVQAYLRSNMDIEMLDIEGDDDDDNDDMDTMEDPLNRRDKDAADQLAASADTGDVLETGQEVVDENTPQNPSGVSALAAGAVHQ